MKSVRAIELRRQAWQKLSELGAFGTYVLGLLALMFSTGIVLGLAFGTLRGVTRLGLATTVDTVDPFDPHVLIPSLFGSTFFVLMALYCVGFCQWSQRAMSIAVMRGGLKFSHAFAGWGNAWRMVSLLLWQSAYITLGLLLLIVPGIRAAFSYALAPYLLVDHPEWTPRQCLAESKRLMEGNRWRFFRLALSFLGWICAVAGLVFLVPFLSSFAQALFTPYLETTFAAFYEGILDQDEASRPRDGILVDGGPIQTIGC